MSFLNHIKSKKPRNSVDIITSTPIASSNALYIQAGNDPEPESFSKNFFLDPQIELFLQRFDFTTSQVTASFAKHNVTFDDLPALNDSDLRDLGILKIGQRKRFLLAVNAQLATNRSASPNVNNHHTITSLSSSNSTDSQLQMLNNDENAPKVSIKSSLMRLLVSFLYCFFAIGVTSFSMVLVHEKVPDMSKYPPLPDIILDNVPHIHWAFEATEWVGLILANIWLLVLVFHKHRFILLRRQFSLFGTVFLLRSITMYITSLSVPGKHLASECKPFVFNSAWDRIQRALEIWFGFGMSIRGVITCGDYMFSGHTTVLTLLNFFITEYTPSKFVSLHIFSWILNVFGVFFILAGHEHYSIDVFIAMYISSRLFLYYHTLANNNHFLQNSNSSHKHRTMIWFPLFHFFEGDVKGAVPNEFVNPFRYTSFEDFLNESTNESFLRSTKSHSHHDKKL